MSLGPRFKVGDKIYFSSKELALLYLKEEILEIYTIKCIYGYNPVEKQYMYMLKELHYPHLIPEETIRKINYYKLRFYEKVLSRR